MKIKILFVFFIFSINEFANAQNFDLKYYSDYTNGFRGVAVAVYLDNIGADNLGLERSELNDIIAEFFEEIFPSTGRTIDKLSRNNYWLCQQALNEWNTEAGEIYMIICADNMYSDDCIVIIAMIENGRGAFSWWGKTVSTKDLE
jgi:hypothetical protein